MLKPGVKERKEEEEKKREKKNKILRGRENEGKNRAESGRRIEREQSIFFLFPKERRREEERQADDGGMRSRGETLSPAAPQDWTPKPKNPTGLPPSRWRHHRQRAGPDHIRRGEVRVCVCGGVWVRRERKKGREIKRVRGRRGGGGPSNRPTRERVPLCSHVLSLSHSLSTCLSLSSKVKNLNWFHCWFGLFLLWKIWRHITAHHAGGKPVRDPVLLVAAATLVESSFIQMELKNSWKENLTCCSFPSCRVSLSSLVDGNKQLVESLPLNHHRRRGHSEMTSLKELQSKLRRWKSDMY